MMEVPLAASILVDHLADAGIQAFVNTCNESIDEEKLRKSLMQYIQNNRRFSDLTSLESNFDFSGLQDYIQLDFFEEVANASFGVDPAIRRNARSESIRKAITYAKPENEEAERVVKKYILGCLDIIRDYYRQRIDRKLWVLAADVVDSINQHSDGICEHILSEMKGLSLNSNPISADNCANYVKNGKVSELSAMIDNAAYSMSKEHPLAPQYGYGFNNNRIVSIPLTDDAMQKYPPMFKISGEVLLNGQPVQPSEDIFNYADRHQSVVTMHVVKSMKMLGDEEDPIQYEAEELIGKTVIRKPTPFPPKRPCAIRIDGNTVIPYIELRTQEILDNNRYIISNKDQKYSRLFVQFTTEPNQKEVIFQIDFGCKAKGDKIRVKDLLERETFRKSVLTSKLIEVLDLSEEGKVLLRTASDAVWDDPANLNLLNEDINFLSRIYAIEQYLGHEFTNLFDMDLAGISNIIIVSDILRKREITEFQFRAQYPITVIKEFQSAIAHYANEPHTFKVPMKPTFKILGVDVQLPVVWTFHNVIWENFEQVRQKIINSNEGDKVMVTFVPVEGGYKRLELQQ